MIVVQKRCEIPGAGLEGGSAWAAVQLLLNPMNPGTLAHPQTQPPSRTAGQHCAVGELASHVWWAMLAAPMLARHMWSVGCAEVSADHIVVGLTRCGLRRPAALPWPSFPDLPHPQVHTSPLANTAAELSLPATNCVAAHPCKSRRVVGRGTNGCNSTPH
jgi:hypothetical protein